MKMPFGERLREWLSRRGASSEPQKTIRPPEETPAPDAEAPRQPAAPQGEPETRPIPPQELETAAGMASTRPLEEGEVENLLAAVGVPLRPDQVSVGLGYSTGLQREHNEDAIYATVSNLSANGRDLLFGLFVVADGMGGHQHGEVASEVAARALAQYLMDAVHGLLFKVDPEVPQEALMDLMREGVRRAHRAVVEHAPGGGTTITAALLLNEQITIAHVGDSRAYAIFPDGRMEVLTRDHSLVKRLEELGQLTAEEAAIHPQRNVLYRALGQAEPFDPDVFITPAPRQGYLMLCSDGLWGVVSEEDLFHIVVSHTSPALACQELVKAANAGGGPDNISVILVQFPRK